MFARRPFTLRNMEGHMSILAAARNYAHVSAQALVPAIRAVDYSIPGDSRPERSCCRKTSLLSFLHFAPDPTPEVGTVWIRTNRAAIFTASRTERIQVIPIDRYIESGAGEEMDFVALITSNVLDGDVCSE